MGSIDPGLVVVSGRLQQGKELAESERVVDEILESIVSNGVSEEELEKVKNQAGSTLEFGEVEVMNRAMNLAFATLSGDPNFVNEEADRIAAVTRQDIQRVAKDILKSENSNVLYYEAVN